LAIQRFDNFSSQETLTKAQCTGKPSYLERISQWLHVEGRRVGSLLKKIGGGVAIGEKLAQNHDENVAQTYLEPISGSMQKPIEGKLRRCSAATEKDRGRSPLAGKRYKSILKHASIWSLLGTLRVPIEGGVT
jgi:hypothetical protein